MNLNKINSVKGDAMKIKRQTVVLIVVLFTLLGVSREGVTQSWPPLPEALDALESDSAVTVETVEVEAWEEGSNYYYAFEPNNTNPTIGFIIYPGGLVDPRAYAPAAHTIAAGGYLTVIIKMKDDAAITYPNYIRADQIISDYPEITKWFIGGHSLGGVSSCKYAKEFTDKVDGVVLWASYPSEQFRIDDTDLKVVSIYGTNDGLVTHDEIETSEEHLPSDTQWVPIEGGNHTQFGWYDTSPYPVQPDDNPADITREDQQAQITQATINFLKQFEENQCVATYLLGRGNPQLTTLRRFRDTVLAQSAIGRKLVEIYYRSSGKAIAVFEHHPIVTLSLRRLVGSLLSMINGTLVRV